jgi:hypothetical protein
MTQTIGHPGTSGALYGFVILVVYDFFQMFERGTMYSSDASLLFVCSRGGLGSHLKKTSELTNLRSNQLCPFHSQRLCSPVIVFKIHNIEKLYDKYMPNYRSPSLYQLLTDVVTRVGRFAPYAS